MAQQLSDDTKALLVALELLRTQLQSGTTATAANTHATEEDFRRRAAQFAAPDAPAETKRPSQPLDTGAFDRSEPMGGSGVPRGLQLGKDLGFAKGGAGPAGDIKAAGGGLGAGAGKALGVAGAVAGAVAGPILDLLQSTVGKFAAVAGPSAILAATFNSGISGFQILSQSVKVFASTLAPVLLPATMLLATGFTVAAEILTAGLGPVLGSFFDVMLGTGIPLLETFADVLTRVVAGAAEVAEMLAELGKGFEFWAGVMRGEDGGKARSQVDGALSDVMKSLRQSMSPKAQISGLGSIGQAVQMAAFNADPLEARLMRQQLAVLEKIEAAVSRRREDDRNPRAHDPVGVGARVRREVAGAVVGAVDGARELFGI